MRNCPNCSTAQPEDRFGDHSECFKCRIAGIGFTYGGGRAVFHGQTVKEGQDRTIAQGRANGYDPVPCGQASFTGGTASEPTRIKDALLSQAAS